MMTTEEEFEKQETNHLISVQLEGYEVIEKVVKSSGNSGRVYLPSAWIGGKMNIHHKPKVSSKKILGVLYSWMKMQKLVI
jgi:putative transposon-encoded protein